LRFWRRAAERLSRGVVLRRHLPKEFGSQTLFVTPDSALAYWRLDLSKVDPLLLRLAAELVRPGMTVWDIGANNGLFSFVAAFKVGAGARVVAVEPDPVLAALLRRSSRVRTGERADVAVVNAAVTEGTSVVEFTVAARGRAASHLSDLDGTSQSGGPRERLHVPSVTLDALAEHFGPPDLVKIDVEGAEERCLRGAARLLATARPVLLCEVGGGACAAVTEILTGHGYVLVDASVAAEERRPLATAVWNTLAIPSWNDYRLA
jgi:FkbM family methyltransferase